MSVGIGVFLGILAGTCVEILVRLFFQRRGEQQQTVNLAFELELNIAKLSDWLKEIGKYRDAINGDSLHNYYGYFDLAKTVLNTASAMFQSGLMYKKLDRSQIEALQVFAWEISPGGSQILSGQIAEHKQNLEACRAKNEMHVWTATYKPEAVKNVDFWEEKFTKHKAALEGILRNLRD